LTDEAWMGSSVNHLTAENADAFLAANPSVLLMMYAPWCGHCKNMKPAYAAAALSAAGKLAAIDCTVHKDVCTKHGAAGYPTIKYFKNGAELAKYERGRTMEDFVKFMANPSVEAAAREKAPPAPPTPPAPAPTAADEAWLASTVNHLTAANADSFLAANPSVLLMMYAPWCGHCKNMKPAYIEAAKTAAGKLAAIDCTVHKEICAKHGAAGYPTIKYFKDGKELAKYEKGRTTQDFIDFMAAPSAAAAARAPKPAPTPTPTPKHEDL